MCRQDDVTIDTIGKHLLHVANSAAHVGVQHLCGQKTTYGGQETDGVANSGHLEGGKKGDKEGRERKKREGRREGERE